MNNFSDMPNKLKEQILNLIEQEKVESKKEFLKSALNEIHEDHHTGPEEILADLNKVHDLLLSKKRIEGLFYIRNQIDNQDHENLIIKFFLHEKDNHSLSSIIRILDDFTIAIKNHLSYNLDVSQNRIIVHEFEIENSNGKITNVKNLCFSDGFFETFENVLMKKWISSSFNKLSILSCMSFSDIKLLAVIKRYLKHISRRFDSDILSNLTSNQAEIFSKFVELFHLRLDPILNQENTKELIENKKTEIQNTIDSISNINEIRLLKDFYEVLLAIVRTNFYQNKDSIAIKIKPKMISFVTGIQPYATIFVFSSDFEAIHLRGAKVSRGGLRWSDRRDFPTEVLGLMRAQMKKNTIIIPSGAKGGFYIYNSQKAANDKGFVVHCYKSFLSGILDITDNLDEKNDIIRPEKVIIPCDLEKQDFDDENYDPYVVVAADKGTGSFSNYANEISAQYNFWLGDAFASGGSNGYDHKALAITSRGTFIAVEKLFNEIGRDIKTQEFTVVGIGDMIGDVFGNGMLLSNKIKLIAAFNHMHIFIDPNPDATISFNERKKMFALPVSSWENYDKNLISTGGGVFLRNQKSIEINPEISKLLDIPLNQTTISPDELIKYILKAKADLLWNGGIGTFVKSENESHEDVSDKANDNIRVNGNELRFKVVGEGGNLGFTQLGRIEAARSGVKINTDFIDNSAGVSCSDREVNIKIALFRALRCKKITLEDRNTLLSDMENEVCDLVLKDNVLQNNALMLEESYKFSGFDQHISLINQLEKLKILNKNAEYIPNDQQIEKMRSTKQFFTRPELAILLTYTKIWLKNEILKTDLPKNKYFEKFLIGYFPKQMQEKFKDEILNHPLRKEIITNYIVNTLINRVGINFISNIANKTGKKINEIIYTYIIIRDSYKLRDIWHDIEYSHRFEEIDSKIRSLLEIRKFAETAVCWYLQQHHEGNLEDLQGNITSLSTHIDYLKKNFNSLSNKKNIAEYKTKVNSLTKQGLKKEFAEELSKINFLIFTPSLIALSNKTSVDLRVITKLYFLIEDKLELRNVIKNINNWPTYSVTQESALTILLNNLTTEHLKILNNIINLYKNDGKITEQQMIDNWCIQKIHQIYNYKEIANKVYFNSEPDYGSVILLINRMQLLS